MIKTRMALGFAALLVAVLALAVPAVPAGAQEYPGGGSITVVPVNPSPGQTITVTATGFEPGSPVTFTLFSAPIDLGTVNADASGVASASYALPSNFPLGAHTVQAAGTAPDGSPLTLSTTINVVPAGSTGTSPGRSGSLPRTGSDSTNLLRGAALLIAAGGAVVLVTRKRSARANA